MYRESDFGRVRQMESISLEEMGSVSLMNRTDTKYVTTVQKLMDILEEAQKAGYRVSEISGARLLDYTSVYYDTPDLKMFTAHRNGKKTRQKVRVRTYLIDKQTFLEIKRKNNRGRTKKKRTRIPYEAALDFGKCAEAAEFLERKSWWKADELSPEVSTTFSRFTLINGGMTERLTVDLNLRFRNFRSGREADLGDIVIIELKQDGRKDSEMRRILLDNRVFPYRISKYCTAVTLTDPAARPGRYKEKLRYIEKLTEKNDTVTD